MLSFSPKLSLDCWRPRPKCLSTEIACVWSVEVKGGRAFIEEEVAGRAPKEGGVAAHVLPALSLKFCGCYICFIAKQSEWMFGGFGRWKRGR